MFAVKPMTADETVKPMTAAEFEQFVTLPENQHKLFEFIGQEPVEVPSNPYVSHIAVRFIRWLAPFVDDNDLGYVTTEAGGYWVSGERYAPDVAYISKARQAVLAKEGYNPNPPELAIEVVSPNDDLHRLRIKIINYLAAGTWVWAVFPEAKRVEVYVPGQPVKILTHEDTLDGGTVLPGFTLALSDIFKA